MTNCVIHPIPLLRDFIEKPMMTYRSNFGTQLWCGMYAWYIEGPKERILVDTGPEIEYLKKKRDAVVEPIQTLEQGLHKLGLETGDIDTVIITHMHQDHVGKANLFPEAKFIVQKAELDFAYNPHPLYTMSYYRPFFEKLNFEAVSGDTRLTDEISLMSTPGHSPGGQSVCIQTAKGKCIIAGMCTITDNYSPMPGTNLPITPPGMAVNLLQAYDSILRIKQSADIILPVHDAAFIGLNTVP